MRYFPVFLLMIVLPFLSYSQNQDYKKYIPLSYAEIDSLVMIPYQKGDFKQCLLLMQAGQ